MSYPDAYWTANLFTFIHSNTLLNFRQIFLDRPVIYTNKYLFHKNKLRDCLSDCFVFCKFTFLKHFKTSHLLNNPHFETTLLLRKSLKTKWLNFSFLFCRSNTTIQLVESTRLFHKNRSCFKKKESIKHAVSRIYKPFWKIPFHFFAKGWARRRIRERPPVAPCNHGNGSFQCKGGCRGGVQLSRSLTRKMRN